MNKIQKSLVKLFGRMSNNLNLIFWRIVIFIDVRNLHKNLNFKFYHALRLHILYA